MGDKENKDLVFLKEMKERLEAARSGNDVTALRQELDDLMTVKC